MADPTDKAADMVRDRCLGWERLGDRDEDVVDRAVTIIESISYPGGEPRSFAAAAVYTSCLYTSTERPTQDEVSELFGVTPHTLRNARARMDRKVDRWMDILG